MKAVEKYDRIGKAEFEDILHRVVQQVHKSTGIEMARIARATPTVISHMPRDTGS